MFITRLCTMSFPLFICLLYTSFSVGITKGKWGTLIESLLAFKKHYDNDDLATDAIPSLKAH